MLATVEDSPGDATGVLALEEEGLGLSILEAEDLAVATDVQLTLYIEQKNRQLSILCMPWCKVWL